MYYQYRVIKVLSQDINTHEGILNKAGKESYRLINTLHLTTDPENDYLILTFEKAAETHPDITPPPRRQIPHVP